jgi:hypothetical protein
MGCGAAPYSRGSERGLLGLEGRYPSSPLTSRKPLIIRGTAAHGGRAANQRNFLRWAGGGIDNPAPDGIRMASCPTARSVAGRRQSMPTLSGDFPQPDYFHLCEERTRASAAGRGARPTHRPLIGHEFFLACEEFQVW